MKSSGQPGIGQLKNRLFSEITKSCGALGARADGAEVFVAEDAGIVAVVEIYLNGVIADLAGGLGANFGLVHGQNRRGNGRGFPSGMLLVVLPFPFALFVAGSAGTFVAEVRKIVMTSVIVGPGDVHARSGRYVNLNV